MLLDEGLLAKHHAAGFRLPDLDVGEVGLLPEQVVFRQPYDLGGLFGTSTSLLSMIN